MKVRVLTEFHDINNLAKVFAVDTIAEFTDEHRVQVLLERGWVELVAEGTEEQKSEETKEEHILTDEPEVTTETEETADVEETPAVEEEHILDKEETAEVTEEKKTKRGRKKAE